MNYYIQGNKDKADQIKAAFEKLGYSTAGWNYKSDRGIYFTNESDKSVDHTGCETFVNLIKTHPDYKELPLPKPHYDIKNFNPFDKVLVRDYEDGVWNVDLFGFYRAENKYHFRCNSNAWCMCIPFEGNEYLLGTTDMPDECYINW